MISEARVVASIEVAHVGKLASPEISSVVSSVGDVISSSVASVVSNSTIGTSPSAVELVSREEAFVEEDPDASKLELEPSPVVRDELSAPIEEVSFWPVSLIGSFLEAESSSSI